MRTLVAVALIPFLLVVPACEQETSRADAPLLGRDAVAADVVGRWTTDPADIDNAAHNQVLTMIRDGRIDATEDDIPRLAPEVAAILRRTPSTFEFNDDGTFTASSHNMTVAGTWAIEGDVMTIHSPETNATRQFRVSSARLEAVRTIEGGKPVALVRQ